MATVNYTVARIETFKDDAHVITWTPLTDTNVDGQALEMPGSADRTVQITGTFDTTTVVMQGSNAPSPAADTDTDWFTLTDPSSTAISKTAAAGEAVLELTRWIRPKVTAGGASTSITVRLLVKRD